MMRFLKHILKYIFFKIKYSGKLIFTFSCNISKDSEFEGMNKIYPCTSFRGFLGFGSYIASHCELNAKIGRFCSIAPYVRCNVGIHPTTYPYVSTAPCFYSLNKNKSQNGKTFATSQMFKEFAYTENGFGVEIGNDVWLCENIFLNGGVKIGDGAVVLAGAVVTKDIPPYAIVGGVPAKILRYRYDEDSIKFLIKIKWWNNSTEWFKSNWELLNDIVKLKAYYDAK